MRYVQVYKTTWNNIQGNRMGDPRFAVPFVPHTAPIQQTQDASDFRSIEELINEGDAEVKDFEAYSFGGTEQIPFGNAQKNYTGPIDRADTNEGRIGEAAYDMKCSGDFEE